MTFEEDFLAHYGIKGMRWGVINKEKQQKRRNSRAKKYEDEAKKYRQKVALLNAKKPRTSLGKRSLSKKLKDLNSSIEIADKAAKAKREGKLTDLQKKQLKVAGVVGGILLASAAYKGLQGGRGSALINKGRAFVNGGEAFKKNPLLAREYLNPDEVFETVVKQINPEYGELGTKVNCRRATFAYEMRRRGLDVAATRTTNGRGQDVSGLYNAINPIDGDVAPGSSGIARRIIKEKIQEAIRGSKTPFTDMATDGTAMGKKTINFSGGQSIFDALGKQRPGSRGELGLLWTSGGGHSVAWEIFGNRPVIFDTQTGKRYRTALELNELVQNASAASYTRLDNVNLNRDFLMRWLKDA
jgi:hypothetical protein